MNIRASSLIYIQSQSGPVGPTGATGATGPTGPTGGTGNTGNSGNSIDYIRKINSDGITVYLVDGTAISITGLSGNSAGSADFSLNPYGILGSTGTTSLSFNIVGVVSGLTASFKSIKGLGGISLGYQGMDLMFRGLSTTSGFGVTNAILYSAGNTASVLVDSNGVNNIFRYETHTSGSTTQHVAVATISKFLQGKNSTGITNINLININGITAYIKNFADTSVNSLYSSGGIWYNKQWYNSSYKDVKAVLTPLNAVQNSGITFNTNIVFRSQNTTPLNFQEYGSCCFCDTNRQCLDYVTRSYCSSITNSVFSASTTCETRERNLETNCYMVAGACCINGACRQISQTLCEMYGGDFRGDIACASAGACPVSAFTDSYLPSDFLVTNNGQGNYVINEASNPPLILVRGERYVFLINAIGHPFLIKSTQSIGTENSYNEGVTNNGVAVGTITFIVPNDAPNILYYNCQFHSSMAGIINIIPINTSISVSSSSSSVSSSSSSVSSSSSGSGSSYY